MLEIKDLAVSVENKPILHDINMTIKTGETHVLFGPNGAGKSTLLSAIMGFPKYKITHGKIKFNGQDITKATLDDGLVWVSAFRFSGRRLFAGSKLATSWLPRSKRAAILRLSKIWPPRLTWPNFWKGTLIMVSRVGR